MTTNMEINDNKAGMEGLDKDKINAVIRKATEGTKYHVHQQKKEEKLQERTFKQNELLKSFSKAVLDTADLKMTRLAEEMETERDLSRFIVHVDMDAFYAAVEMRDEPKLRNIPMAVGSNSMLSTSNYAARKFGVRAAMPGFIAKKLCPSLVIVPCNFEKYTKTSGKIREVMADYDPSFAPMSLDEAYLDLTEFMYKRQREASDQKVSRQRVRYGGECQCWLPRAPKKSESNNQFDGSMITKSLCNKCGKDSLTLRDTEIFGNDIEEVVRELRFRIEQKTGLTASAGIAANSLLAKVCSDRNKPNGQFYLKRDRGAIMDFIRSLPTRKIPGIGSVCDSLLKGIGIETCSDLYEQRGKLFLLHSEIQSRFFLKVSLGLGSSFISNDSDRKSISVERTFSEKNSPEELIHLCESLSKSLAEDVAEKETSGKTVTLKYKTVEFDVKTRAATSSRYINSFEEIFRQAKELLLTEIAAHDGKLRLRLMGVRLSNLITENYSLKKEADITKFFLFEPVNSNQLLATNSGLKSQANNGFELDGFLPNETSSVNAENSTIYAMESVNSVNSASHFIQLAACPVCSHKIPNLTSEIEMSKHVDECLSRQTVGEILKEQKGSNVNASNPSKGSENSSNVTGKPGSKRKLVAVKTDPSSVNEPKKSRGIESYLVNK